MYVKLFRRMYVNLDQRGMHVSDLEKIGVQHEIYQSWACSTAALIQWVSDIKKTEILGEASVSYRVS